jgi:hypothetical protein
MGGAHPGAVARGHAAEAPQRRARRRLPLGRRGFQRRRRGDDTRADGPVSADALEMLPGLVWHYGEPFADQSAIPSMRLAEVTRRHVTVALYGEAVTRASPATAAMFRRSRSTACAGSPVFQCRLSVAGCSIACPFGNDPRGARLRLRKLFQRLPMSELQRHALVMAYFTEEERRAPMRLPSWSGRHSPPRRRC